MTDDSSHSQRIDILAGEFLARRRCGENPTIEEYCVKHPDLAEDIRELFPTLEMMEVLKPDLETTQAKRSLPDTLERIGDYRILGEIGRGGMGVVYEAEQESLGRRVALKVLSARHSQDDKGLERFQREAQAAAKMHHTNIVPVFEIGQESGYVFYAMQLIKGQGLDRVIKDVARLRADSEARKKTGRDSVVPKVEPAQSSDCQDSAGMHANALARSLVAGRFRAETLIEPSVPARRSGPAGDVGGSATQPGDTGNTAVLPGGTDLTTTGSSSRKYYRSVARIGRQVAEALAYSHARGVVHRDIKPSNLLLDAAGVVWVTDFGIAKGDDQDITHTGDIVGTIRYMSPGRLRGRYNVLSDIYGLGVTLYELTVLKPAFDVRDRLDLIQEIKGTEPALPRSVDPHIPVDLETIILKAMDKEAASRYQSADDLAEDLRRFIEDEPIQARRVSMAGRLVRWARRNKRLAVSLSGVVVLTFVLLIGSLLAASHSRRQEHKLERNLYFAEMNLAGQAAAGRYGADTIRAQLSKWLPQQDDTDLRGWEWYYLYSLVHREHFSSERLGGWVWSVDWNPDGTRFVASIHHIGWKIWDVATGQLIQAKDVPRIAFIAWSPDGMRLASTDFDGNVEVWDAVTGQELVSFQENADTLVDCIAWSPDGRWLATASKRRREEHMLRIWDAATGNEIRKLNGHTMDVEAVQWSPDGTCLASGSWDGTTRIWDATTGAELTRFDTPLDHVGKNYVLAVCWSPDGSKLVSARDNGTIQVWDVATKGEVAAFKADTEPVHCVQWRSNAPQLVSAHGDGTIRLWDTTTGQALTAYFGHTHEARCVKWAPGGSHFASTSLDGTVRVWDVLARSPERTLGDAGKSNGQWDHGGGLQGHIDWSRDGARLASGHLDGSVAVWDVATGQRRVVFQHRMVQAVAWSPDAERLAFGGRDSAVRLWNASTDEVVALQGKVEALRSIAWNHNGSRLATAGYHDGIVIWNMDTNSKITAIRDAHGGEALCVDWNCDGTLLASVGWDATVKVWNPATGTLIWQAKPGSDPILSARWSPDGTQLATAQYGAVVLWDGLTGAKTKSLDKIEENFETVDWSPDSTRLATGSRSSVSVWDVASGHVALRIPSRISVKCVRWSHDGKCLATGCYDGTIRIYDATIGYLQNSTSVAGSSTPD